MGNKIVVDADACPYKEEIISLSEKYKIELFFVFSHSHISEYPRQVKTVVVDNHKEAADLAIANLISKGDLVLTQDYGLAAMVLAKQSLVLLTNGTIVDDHNIEQLLFFRHSSAKNRKKRVRIKGSGKLTQADRDRFVSALEGTIKRMMENSG